MIFQFSFHFQPTSFSRLIYPLCPCANIVLKQLVPPPGVHPPCVYKSDGSPAQPLRINKLNSAGLVALCPALCRPLQRRDPREMWPATPCSGQGRFPSLPQAAQQDRRVWWVAGKGNREGWPGVPCRHAESPSPALPLP